MLFVSIAKSDAVLILCLLMLVVVIGDDVADSMLRPSILECWYDLGPLNPNPTWAKDNKRQDGGKP